MGECIDEVPLSWKTVLQKISENFSGVRLSAEDGNYDWTVCMECGYSDHFRGIVDIKNFLTMVKHTYQHGQIKLTLTSKYDLRKKLIVRIVEADPTDSFSIHDHFGTIPKNTPYTKCSDCDIFGVDD